MSLLTEHSYWLRSRSSDKPPSIATSSPTSPPLSPSPMPTPKESTQCTITRPRNTRHRRKRRFHQLNAHNEDVSSSDDNEDIDLNLTTNNIQIHHRTHKKAKLSRTIKFTLNLETVLSREASLNANSPIVTNKRKRLPRIEEYEVPTSHRITRRNPFVCCYEFFNGYRIGIVATLGHATDLKAAIKILSQELVSGRAKASIQTQKNSYLVYIKTRKGTLIGCSILHIDHVWKRVNIEMFAVDQNWRGNGFASCMVYLIQYRMLYFAKYDLFVCAAKSAVPFWSNAKYKFVYAHKGILEQHEVEDEKHGGTKHLIWYGTPAQARCNLLQYFVQTQ